MTNEEFEARINAKLLAMTETLELVNASQLHTSQLVESIAIKVDAIATAQQKAQDEMTEIRASIADLRRVATAHEDRLNDLDGKGGFSQ